MKRFYVSGLLTVLLLFSVTLFAQDKKSQAFWDRYDQARLSIAKHNAGGSIKILEELYVTDSLNPNVGYLLGVAKIIVGQEPERAARLFEMADKNYDQLWDNPGVGPPEHLFYYMILAYCRSGQCSKAKESLMRLEATFFEEKEFLHNDEYYLIDGRKWANMCAEPTMKLLEVPERLVKPDLRISTQPHKYSTYSTLYGVQVAALLEPQMTRKFDGLKNVEVYVDMHGVYRYVIGNFNFQSQAEKMLEVVKGVGYADAFIVNITDDERYPLEVVSLDQRSPKAQIRGTVDYRIQLAAFKESLPDESALYYLMIDSISEVSVDDLKLLTVGSFISYGDAILRRDELRLMGFRDAFIVAFNEGRKVSIEDARQYLRRVE
ncbi:MAG: SPOR domain-containing protein [Flavobacteriales bacterium]|nr:SPOR domain-containing protein [Flavobacteriales bacterium]